MPRQHKSKHIESLETVIVPSAMRSLVKMNLIHSVNVSDHKVDITLTSATLTPEVKSELLSTGVLNQPSPCVILLT